MAASDKPSKTEELVNLAREHLAALGERELGEAELKLLRAAVTGETTVCGPSSDDDDASNDPANSDKWGADREIRAALIRWLCFDTDAKSRVDPAGLQALGAKITGQLNLSFGNVAFPLGLVRCRLAEPLTLRSTQIPALYLSGSWTRSVAADGMDVKGSVFLREGFTAEGEVQLLGARISGQLACVGGAFNNPGGTALDADGVDVKGSVFLREGFRAEGEVRLLGAQIGGQLSCIGGAFRNPGRDALSADRVDVKGDVFLSEGFTAEGEVRLLGAKIGGQLNCSGGAFRNPGGTALGADGANVKGGVFLHQGFTAEGEVRLLGAQIGGQLDCSGGAFSKVNAETAVIKASFFWRNVVNGGQVTLDLTNASAGAIVDDDQSWPAKGKLLLDGFEYKRISAGPRDAKKRLEWLDRLDEFTLQPYRQLAKVLRETGDNRGAKRVLYEMERRRWQYEAELARAEGLKQHGWRRLWGRVLGRLLRFSGALFSWTIGYGVYPLKVWRSLAVLTALGFVFLGLGYLRGNVTPMATNPTGKAAYDSFEAQGRKPDSYPGFNPLVYSVENSVQVLRLGQSDYWAPDPSPRGPRRAPVASASWWERLPAWPVFARLPACWTTAALWFTDSSFLRGFRWFQIMAGWVLVALFLAGVTGITRRE